MVRIAVVCLGAALAACGAEKGQQPVTAPSDVTTSPETTVTPLSDDVSSVRIAKSIREKCGLSATEAYFEYNSAAIDEEASQVLGKLADCFTSGPMAGERMKLVGRADPRGGEEYNMVLGDSRASSVGSVLIDFGMKQEQISTSSRGEMDAMGHDELTWAKDRRVDVLEG